MDSQKTVLFPTDYSAASAHALCLACDLALAQGAHLIALHVIEPPMYCGQFNVPSAPPAFFSDNLNRWLRDCRGSGALPPVECRFAEGFAWEEILRVADESQCELIVMGSEGKRGIERALLGSAAEQVAQRARCPVLIDKAPAEPAAAPTASKEAGWPLASTILFPTDLSDRAREAFPVASALAANGSRLIVLHVLGASPVAPEAQESILAERLRAIHPDGSGVSIEYRVAAGELAEEILRVAEMAPCDLIVMSSHGRTGLKRLLMGSVAEEVFRAARGPVLIVRSAAPEPVSESEGRAPPETCGQHNP